MLLLFVCSFARTTVGDNATRHAERCPRGSRVSAVITISPTATATTRLLITSMMISLLAYKHRSK